MTDINNWIQSDDELFIKNVMLTTEFNKYLLEHPEELDKSHAMIRPEEGTTGVLLIAE